MFNNKVIILKSDVWSFPPHKKIAGVPLFQRTLLTLGKSGVKKLFIFADEYETELKKLIPIHSLTPEIDFISEIPKEAIVVEAAALYDPEKIQETQNFDDALITLITNQTEKNEAEKFLWSSLRKPIENDGIVAYFLGRPISRLISKIIINTPISPNQATLASLFFALSGAYFVASAKTMILGALLYWISFVFDCVDGELARLKFQGSRLGQWLDTIADDTATVAFSVGLGVLAWNIFDAPVWFYLSASSAGLYLLSSVFVYRVLKHMPVVDTAQYPYFFLGEGGAAAKEKSLLTMLAYLVRRDVVLFLHLIFSVFGLVSAMLALQMFLNFGMAFITFTDVAVKFFTRSE